MAFSSHLHYFAQMLPCFLESSADWGLSLSCNLYFSTPDFPTKALMWCTVFTCSADEGDVLLLCDGCDQGAHLRCCGLKTVPRGEWLCADCAPSRGGRKVCPAAPLAVPMPR